ncbi:porin [Pandoraea sputorum]|uniref:porin n=1 Tax=Pandoraea sputorum TaxID=93222 RepID=UPI002D7E9C8C|nr:porin [Pandoraea sputorum]
MMKMPVAAGLLLGAVCAMPSVALAQSSVTLYGIIDTSLQYVNHAGGKQSQISMVTGNGLGTRWGITGTEDLGGGLQSVFKLENGFDSTNGKLLQGSREFGRQAYVGLTSREWGSVLIGRQYDPLIDQVLPTQGNFFVAGYWTAPGDVDNSQNTARVSNSVKWTSPVWRGVQIEGMYALGGVAGAQASGQTYSAAGSYTFGPARVAAGYLHIDNGNARATTRPSSTTDFFFVSAVNRAYASAKSIDIYRAGGRYTLGNVTLGGYYSQSYYNADAASTFRTTQRYDSYGVYAVWQISPALAAQTGYDYLNASGDSSAHYHQVSAAVDYSLSKRTDLFCVVTYAHATGYNGIGPAQAAIATVYVDAGVNSQMYVTAGVRHKF